MLVPLDASHVWDLPSAGLGNYVDTDLQAPADPAPLMLIEDLECDPDCYRHIEQWLEEQGVAFDRSADLNRQHRPGSGTWETYDIGYGSDAVETIHLEAVLQKFDAGNVEDGVRQLRRLCPSQAGELKPFELVG